MFMSIFGVLFLSTPLQNHLHNEQVKVCYSDKLVIWIFAIQLPTVLARIVPVEEVGDKVTLGLLGQPCQISHRGSLGLWRPCTSSPSLGSDTSEIQHCSIARLKNDLVSKSVSILTRSPTDRVALSPGCSMRSAEGAGEERKTLITYISAWKINGNCIVYIKGRQLFIYANPSIL